MTPTQSATPSPTPTASPSSATARTRTVVAVLVAHDGAHFLARTLAAVAGQRRPPDVVVAVDTGSSDATGRMLDESAVVDRVVSEPPGTGFAAAVHAALAELRSPMDWIWVIHDDSAPAPDCLAELIRATESSASLALVGPKVLGWDDPRRLLEVGVSVSGGGRRETGLERGEQDQGQHDGQRDVLAVGSQGALVRGSVWEELGGFDPQLLLFREDLDLGWRINRAGHRVAVVTDAVIYHAEAAARGRRPLGVEGGRSHLADRSSALLVLLGNGRGWTLPLQWLRLVVGTLLRAAGFLLAKAPSLAADELRAFGQVLVRPDLVVAARRVRREHREVPPSQLRAFFPRPGSQLRRAAESVSGLVASRAAAGAGRPAGGGLLETGPTDDDTESMVSSSGGWWRRALRRPGVLLTLALGAVALLAWRSLYAGGALFGGALLPAPSGASDLWQTFTEAWHPVSTGSPVPGPTYLVPLSLLSTLMLGKATWAVAVLLAVAVPLAGMGSFVALRALGLSRRLRLWASAAYALSPALLAGVAQGRLGTVVVALLLPWLAVVATRTVGTAHRPGHWTAAATSAVLLAVMTAFAPIVWWLAVVLAAVAGWRWAPDRAARLRLGLAVGLAPLLLLPWSLRLVTDPAVNLLEAGLPMPRSGGFAPWQVLLFAPGGPGSAPLALSGVLTLVALVAMLRARQPVVRGGLLVAAVAFVAALLTATVTVTPEGSAQPVEPWPGPALVLATAGTLVAAAAAARGARGRLASARFGWRQPVTLALAVGAVAATVGLGGWWVGRGADGPLLRGNPEVLPAFVAAAASEPDQVRTLVLQRDGEQLVYSLLRSDSPQLGDAETGPPADALRGLDAAVSEVASGRGGTAVDDLRRYAVRYLLVAAPVDPTLESTLDSVPGLVRVANPGSDALWQLQQRTGRLALLAPRVAGAGQAELTVLPSGALAADTPVVAGPGGRALLLAENADRGWVATLDGTDLHRSTAGWQQTFAVPSAGGELVLRYDGSSRTRWLFVEGLFLLAAVVVAIPGRRDEEKGSL